MTILAEKYRNWRTPAVTIVALNERSPFKVLVSCVISLRTRDEITAAAAVRLFDKADTPAKMLQLSQECLASLLYPAGFYRTKAGQILEISRLLMTKYSGQVPADIDELLKFKGVGRKTANLVITLGFGQPGICVDTHVHRICNRWGYVTTNTPSETERVLRNVLPPEYWIRINDILVAFGQNLCHPLSPHCSCCPVSEYCPRIGVRRSR